MPQVKALRSKRRAKDPVGKGKILAAQTARMLERRFQVMNLRRDGWQIHEIAPMVDASIATVKEDIKAVLTLVSSDLQESADEMRTLQLQRLDQLLSIHTKLAQGYDELIEDPRTGKLINVNHPPNHNSAAIILQVEARRSKLMALDIPDQKAAEASGIRIYVGVDTDQV